MGKLIKPIYNISSREVQLTTLGLFLFALLKIRLWESDRRDYIYNFITTKYAILYETYFNSNPNETEYTETEYTQTEYTETDNTQNTQYSDNTQNTQYSDNKKNN
jgi:hypothetical protein